jgi:ABC-type branched-subunit amino acid transport system ATPase component
MSEPEPLYLSSLRVEGVRAIRSLEIRELGRVNLFVGTNNAGKTSLLEALRLFAARGIPQAFRDVLLLRGVELSPTPAASLEEWGILVESVQSLFHGGFSRMDDLTMKVGPISGGSPVLTVSLEWRRTNDLARFPQKVSAGFPTLVVDYGNDDHREMQVEDLAVPPHPYIENQVPFAVFVPPFGIAEGRLGALWDRITLTEWESQILAALRIIVPGLEGLSFIFEGNRRRVPVAKLKNAAQPVPLRSMGEGVNHLLSIALAMVNARGGFLLIDEFENGLYHAVQNEIWDVILDLAERLDVQVFASTHSWDCIVAFQDAANRSPAVGMLYRLEREEDGAIYAETYTEEEVAIAAEQQIEVR